MEAIFVYVTAASAEEAARIGRTLVEERLAACANLLDGMRSIYRWEGKVEEAAETVLILKTERRASDRLAARVRELHPYDCPCVVALPLVAGDAGYLRWIQEQVAADDSA
jgi:periplasmic divalent cation tolerance protein